MGLLSMKSNHFAPPTHLSDFPPTRGKFTQPMVTEAAGAGCYTSPFNTQKYLHRAKAHCCRPWFAVRVPKEGINLLRA